MLLSNQDFRKGPEVDEQEEEGSSGKRGPLGYMAGFWQGQGQSNAEDIEVPRSKQKGWIRITAFGNCRVEFQLDTKRGQKWGKQIGKH